MAKNARLSRSMLIHVIGFSVVRSETVVSVVDVVI